eukprot:GHRR01030834.1.p2 GENE.GHRR01030834.1~~GHRR01030834.1.p2  ORF type:complete len:100 (-),score=9.28 GHRR01030834.1:206-505(-)
MLRSHAGCCKQDELMKRIAILQSYFTWLFVASPCIACSCTLPQYLGFYAHKLFIVEPEKRIVANVGKMDAKKHLATNVTNIMGANINQAMGTMLDTVVF